MVASRRRRSNPQLIAPIEEPVRLTRRAMIAAPSRIEEDRPMGRAQNTLDG